MVLDYPPTAGYVLRVAEVGESLLMIRDPKAYLGLCCRAEDPINSKTEFSPTDVEAMKKANRTVRNILAPHRYLIEFLSSRFQAYRYRDRYLVLGCMRTVIRACERCRTWG
jgi:phosphatidylinositol 4-kinase